MEKLTVVKVGGKIIDDPLRLDAFLELFSKIEGPKILVHGGGKLATDIGDKLGVVSRYIDGRRITDAATLRLVTMVYAGLINKTIVVSLQGKGCYAVGFTGADGNLIHAQQRPVKDIDYGFVGDILPGGVNVALLKTLLSAGYTPVIAPITHDRMGSLLNTNADAIAMEISCCMAVLTSVTLVYCFEKKGVLHNREDETSVIPYINEPAYRQLKANHIITEGMIPKMDNAFDALNRGLVNVTMGCAADLTELLSGKKGTRLQWI